MIRIAVPHTRDVGHSCFCLKTYNERAELPPIQHATGGLDAVVRLSDERQLKTCVCRSISMTVWQCALTGHTHWSDLCDRDDKEAVVCKLLIQV